MSHTPTERTRVRRHPERADYDRAAIHRVIDDALLCTVSWVDEDGRPRALPTIQARLGDTLYLHGSRAARAWRFGTGPPKDAEEDLDLDVWAGTLPLRMVAGTPAPAPDLRAGIGVPAYLPKPGAALRRAGGD